MKKLYFIMLLMLLIAPVASGRDLYYIYHSYVQGVGIDPCPTGPIKVSPVNGWYTIDLVDLTEIYVSTSGNEENLKGFFDEKYKFHLSPEDLGKPIVPIREPKYLAPGFTILPWYGDYHIEIAEDLSAAIFTQAAPYLKEGYKLYFRVQRRLENGEKERKSYTLHEVGNYEYMYKFIGEEKLLKGSNIYIHTNVPGDNFSITDSVVPCGKYSFIGEDGKGKENLTEDFEGTIRVTHDGQYGTPMTVEFIPLGGGTTSADEIEMETAVPRYYNLQGVEVANPGAGVFIEVKNGNSRLVKH